MNISKDNNISMVTYPRSGKNWLYWYISNNTNLKINFTHYFDFDDSDEDYELYKKIFSDSIITMVRDPIECIASINTMEKSVRVQERIDSYIDHYKFVLKNAKMFFLFEDLKSNTNKIVSHICEEFNGTMNVVSESFDDYKEWHLKTQDSRKLVSSKNDEEYRKNVELVKGLDLSEHYKLYNLAKEKCIKFSEQQ